MSDEETLTELTERHIIPPSRTKNDDSFARWKPSRSSLFTQGLARLRSRIWEVCKEDTTRDTSERDGLSKVDREDHHDSHPRMG